MDVANPALGIECPGCGLLAARFTPNCSNCGRTFWPSRAIASSAFRAWKAADSARATARPFDTDLPPTPVDNTIDYDAKAHRLGIHLFPKTWWPIVISLGFLFLALGAVPIGDGTLRLVFAVLGAVIFFIGIGGWWLVEDIKLYEESVAAVEEATH